MDRPMNGWQDSLMPTLCVIKTETVEGHTLVYKPNQQSSENMQAIYKLHICKRKSRMQSATERACNWLPLGQKSAIAISTRSVSKAVLSARRRMTACSSHHRLNLLKSQFVKIIIYWNRNLQIAGGRIGFPSGKVGLRMRHCCCVPSRDSACYQIENQDL